MKQRERFWEFQDIIEGGDWYFRSSDYDVEIDEVDRIMSEEWNTPLPQRPFRVVKILRHKGQLIGCRRYRSSITEQQAEAAHQWAVEQDLFGQSDRGVTRIDVPDSVTGF